MLRKYWLIAVLIGLIVICGITAFALWDRPSFSQDEVSAIVRNHFALSKYSTPPSTSLPEYIGQGRWAGKTGNRSWYFYEKTRTIEIR